MPILSNVLSLSLALVAADEPGPPQPAAVARLGDPAADARQIWHLTLREAIRIGLDNSEVVRVISLGGQAVPGGFDPADGSDIVIAPLNRDVSAWDFQSAVMAHVRSIEQQYWALSQMQVMHYARQAAVTLGEEILARERAERDAGRSNPADVAEAEQQLGNFKLNLVSATTDVITTERQLRNILGLPAADNRRIVPATAPTEAEVDPDWKDSLAAMDASQPEIVRQRRLLRVAELKDLIEAEGPDPSAERREASRRELERQQARLEQLRRQSTHSLARFFLEIDANYKQLQAAGKLRDAAQQRLEAQRASHEEGKVTISRLLDAVAQYANALAQEAHFRSSYNTSIAAFEEAKGTLLATDKITVADPPARRKAYIQAKVDQVAPAAFEGPAVDAPAASHPASAMYTLRAKLGGVQVLEVEVEASPASTSRPTSPGR